MAKAMAEPESSERAVRRFRVRTVTASYDPVEDRMRLNARAGDGEARGILLTRRLLDRLVPVIVARMERRAPAGRMRDVLPAMARERARLVRDAAPAPRPVETPAGTPAALCIAVRLDVTPKGPVLVFRDITGLELLLPVATADACAFLDVVARVYAKAGWSRAVFPDWLAFEDGAVARGSGRALN